MATIFVGATSATSTNNTLGTVAVPWPAGAQVGDFALLACGLNTSGHTDVLTPATGWTTIRNGDLSSAGSGSAYWRLLTAADITDGQVTVTTQTQPSSTRYVAAVVLYRGHAPAGPVEGAGWTDETAITNTHSTPAVAASGIGRTIRVVVERSSFNTAWTAPAGQVVRVTGYGGQNGTSSLIVTDAGGDELATASRPAKSYVKTSSSANARGISFHLLTASTTGGTAPSTAVAYHARREHLVTVSTDPAFTYQWTQLSGPAAVINNPSSAVADYLRPARLAADQVFRCRVTGTVGSPIDTTVTVPADRAVQARTAGADGVFR